MPVQQVEMPGVPPGMRYAWVADDSQESGVGIALVPDNGSPAPGEVPPPPGRGSANEEMTQQATQSAIVQQQQVQVRAAAEAQAKAAGLNPAALDAADPTWWKWQNPVGHAVGYNGGDMTARTRNEEMASAQLRNELQNTPGAKATRLPNGSIFDPKSGATYSDPRLVPPALLQEANVALTPTQQQEADNNRKAPAMKDGVQLRVEGNPTKQERANGINSTQPAGNPPLPAPAPSPTAAVFPAPAPTPAPVARRQGAIRSIQPIVLTPEQRASMDPTTLNLVLSGQMAPPPAAGAGPGVGVGTGPQFRRGTAQPQGQDQQAPFPAPTGGRKPVKFHVMSAGGRGSLTEQPPAPLDPGDGTGAGNAGGTDIPPDPGDGAVWDPVTKQWVMPGTGTGTGTGTGAGAGAGAGAKPGVGGGQKAVPVYSEDGTLVGHNVTLGAGSVDPDTHEVLKAPKTQFVRTDRPNRDAAAQGQDVASASHLAAAAAATTQLLPYQIAQIVNNLGLSKEQAARIKALLPGEMLIQGATLEQMHAAIANAAGQLGLARDRFDFDKGIKAAGLTGSYNGNPTLAAQELGLKADTEYAASRRADLLANLQRAGVTGTYEGAPTQAAIAQQATITGYDAEGNPTFAREQVGAAQDLANFRAQSDAANQAAQIALSQGNQAEAQRQFNIKHELDNRIQSADLALRQQGQGFNQQLQAAQFEMQRRADPSSFLEKAYAMRGLPPPDVTPNTPYPSTATVEGGGPAMIPQQQYQAQPQAPFAVPGAGPSTVGQARFAQIEGGPNTSGIGNLAGWTPPPDNPAMQGQWQNYGGPAPQYGVTGTGTAGAPGGGTGTPVPQPRPQAPFPLPSAGGMDSGIAGEGAPTGVLPAPSPTGVGAGGYQKGGYGLRTMTMQAQPNQGQGQGQDAANEANFVPGMYGLQTTPAQIQPNQAPSAPSWATGTGTGGGTSAGQNGMTGQGATSVPGAPGNYQPPASITSGAMMRGPGPVQNQQQPYRVGLMQGQGQGQASAAPFAAPAPPRATGGGMGGALSYDELTRSKALPPGIGNVFAGQNAGSFNTAGGVPLVSAQKYGSLSPLERQGFDATLKATGNDPNSYLDQVQQLSQTGSAPSQFQRRLAAPQRTFAGY